MVLSPFLRGAIAAEQCMVDAQRDAERRRLIRSVKVDRPDRRGWLLRLLVGPGVRETFHHVRHAGERRYGTPQHFGSMKP